MRKFILIKLFIIILASSCVPLNENKIIEFPKIDRKPDPDIYYRDVLTALPNYSIEDAIALDLRGYNLSELDLTNSFDSLMVASFDDRTIWPTINKMPINFDFQKIMAYGKNPGLCLHSLHELGYTGKNIGIAIIDQKLLVDHQEYKNQLKLYEEQGGIVGGRSTMHGTAVASLAVGKSVGVAPEADLYYIATRMGNDGSVNYITTAIKRILEVNKQLPHNKKIRVILIPVGWKIDSVGVDELLATIELAISKDIFIISSSLESYSPVKFNGIGRYPFADPDNYKVYRPSFWGTSILQEEPQINDRILVPMDSRVTASPSGIDEYVYYFRGSWSWAMPYLAGIYVLAAQTNPKITPELFWNVAMDTGRYNYLEYNGMTYELGPIIDPVAIILKLDNRRKVYYLSQLRCQ
ncbi:MAG: peptidase S8 [Anaerolineaceae bacterium]|nr:peptidase S8 [Anaerolineaceae bacterium]